ncbi:benzoate-CoA ligase family protein [Pseudomaricurvus alkylphenolicus]|uniref:benzoate-CoA ligase family protein n=1 Tax=Pseudomaricurvus alkylphenolicus TaxID=1306991 RepID=UPI001422D138|nr:benzoate-CoA ligase family protein [Pseudomaricurvus alkylphenolicus]NIB43458.1 benzoate-CoA ligase family protein [Pseudomaricurvus alkylphenolicus]
MVNTSEAFNFANYLMEINQGRFDKTAFIDDVRQISYGELFQGIRRVAAGLQSLGVRREERILLVLQDSIDFPLAFLGAMYAGIVPVAVNTLLTADDYAYMLEHSGARALIVSGGILPTLNSALARADHSVQKVVVSRPESPLHPSEIDMQPFVENSQEQSKPTKTTGDSPGFWLYSSGSTGRPKGTVHSHANPYWTIEHYAKGVLNLTQNDVCFSAAKLFFAYGLGNGLTFPMGVGATSILMAERPTPEAVFERLTNSTPSGKPTIFYGAPTGFAGMLASTNLPDRSEVELRLVSSAGEALPPELGKRFSEHFGVDIIDGIGSTEMLHIFLSNRPGDVHYGTTGHPVEGYQVELRGPDGESVEDGEPGDLYISGPSAAMMYWGNRAKTRDTFQGRWVKSGDKYIHNPEGTYTYAGRSDDMLKVSGIYVSPFEVEATVMEHPAVLEAAVVGVEDDAGLTKTKAYVVCKPGQSVSQEELKSFTKERLAPYKYPRLIEFISELPKTATGKIQRFKLRSG